MRREYFTPTHLFDRFLSYCRYRHVYRLLKKNPNIKTIYDLGCGCGNLVRALVARGYDAYGIDVQAAERVLAGDLNQPLCVPSNSVDLVTSLANIEHLEQPQINLQEIHRVLRPGGRLLLTTPSSAAKPILEYLAFSLRLIDPTEILDHKRYFSKNMLEEYLRRSGFNTIRVRRFQMGMNLCATAIK